MKLKYYLRGLGIGIIITTVILAISFSKREGNISDEEVIARASALGMVMQNEAESENTGMAETEVQQPATEEKQTYATNVGTDLTNEEDTESTEVTPVEDPIPEEEPETAVGAENTTELANIQEGSFRLVIQKGDVCRVVCETLQENDVIADAETLRKYLFEIGYASNMSVGEYDIPYGLTYEEVANILKAGPVERES